MASESAEVARFSGDTRNTSKQSSRSKTIKSTTTITVDNADAFLQWIPEYKVIVCREHEYAIGSVAQHLRIFHSGKDVEKREVVAAFASYDLQTPKDVLSPPPLGEPFQELGKPMLAFICEEPECQRISISRDEMRKHCNREHGWKSSKEYREHWHRVWVQSFFKSAGLQKYFTVDYTDQEQDEYSKDEEEASTRLIALGSEQSRQLALDEVDLSGIYGEWDAAVDRHQETLEIADAEVAKTDHTLWFKRTQWTEHLAGCNLKHLSRASRLPDRDEQVLQRVVELNSSLIERCVSGLSTLDHETRRWLRSAKQAEADVRPIARLQNSDSQQRYAVYAARLVCYCLRVLEDSEHGTAEMSPDEQTESDEDSDATISDDGEETSEGEMHSRELETAADVFKDARRLFPWQGRQKELARELKKSVQECWEVADQMKALLDFYESLIFQGVRGDVFKSAILHFLAVLGIDEEINRLRQANDFSYMLAGVVYCVRVLAVEIILPSTERDDQNEEDDKRFRQVRGEYLADGSYSVMSKMLSMLAYGKHLAMNHGNSGAVSWSEDRLILSYRGKPIALSRFRSMVQGAIAEAEDMLWRDLLHVGLDERFEIPLDELRDDVTWTKRGVSFIDNTHNGLREKRKWTLKHILSDKDGSKMRNQRSWAMPHVRRYLRKVDRFRELLLLCMHLTGGQPARGTEMTTLRFKNGYLQDRNIFVMHGQMVFVTRYHKSQSQMDKPKVIPRFLPWRVGQVLAVYLAYLQPVQEYLSVQVKGSGWSDYIWANEQGPWETDRLTRIMIRESQKRLGTRLTTHDYRHVAISIGREVIGEQFARGYTEETIEVEEAEVEDDDALEMSAGRGAEIGVNRYGVSVDIVKHLSSRSIDTFRPLSRQWHEFLELASYGRKGQKRGVDTRRMSVSVEGQELERERRMETMRRNNGIRGWGAMARDLRGQQNPSDDGRSGGRASAGSDSRWWFGGGSQDDHRWLTPAVGIDLTSSARSAGSTAQSALTVLTGLQTGSSQGLGIRWQETPHSHQAQLRQTDHTSQQQQQQQWQRQTPYMSAGWGLTTPPTIARLEASPLLYRSTALFSSREIQGGRVVGEEEIKKAMRKVLGCEEVAFRSEEQREALRVIVSGEQRTPLVVVLPTGGGKSLLFMAPACLDDPGVTIVVVPYRALVNNLVMTARTARIDCIEYKPGEQNPAALVFVSADFVAEGQFLSYAQLLSAKGILRRVFVDESHLTFTASDWRPKLAEVRAVRGLKVPTIMLTATLPVLLEFELEASMAAQMAQYIRAVTTRVKTRYMVERCKPGTLEEGAIQLCRRMKKHLGLRKGVVYSRSRTQCEGLAKELECAYYHAGAVDNEERLQSWLEKGGLIVATSALGTGVDFPGIVFILHVDLPYSMIDFAQESGRAGRAGEDVDSIIMVEEGKVERVLSSHKGGLDEKMICEFVTTKECRRRVMSLYLDNKEVECGSDTNMAKCDGCGEGLTALERSYVRAARERQLVEETLDELSDSCVLCFVECADKPDVDWQHEKEQCPQQEWQREQNDNDEQGTRENGAEIEKFRRSIRFEARSHSCFKCGLSQKLCRTGQDSKETCQWPNVMVSMVRRTMSVRGGAAILNKVGFRGNHGDWDEYARWLGLRHERRVWGELMSNATALMIELIVWMREGRTAGSRKQDEEIEAEADRVRQEKEVEAKSRQFMANLRSWEGVCLVCKAATRQEVKDHSFEDCARDEFLTEMMKRGADQIERMKEPRCEQGRCWVGWQRCERKGSGTSTVCRWSRLAGNIAIALLYVGSRAREAQAWVEEDADFVEEAERDGQKALERFFKSEVDWSGIESNRLCELIRLFG
jgi:superfamily II DNA helicase RecQ